MRVSRNYFRWFRNQVAASQRTKRGRKELPHVRGQGQQLRVPGCDGAGTAERSYLVSEIRGGREETPRIRGQGQPGEDTPRLRSEAVAERSYPVSKVSGGREELPRVRGQGRRLGGDTSLPRPGVVTLRSHPEPKGRGGS